MYCGDCGDHFWLPGECLVDHVVLTGAENIPCVKIVRGVFIGKWWAYELEEINQNRETRQSNLPQLKTQVLGFSYGLLVILIPGSG